MDSPNPDKVQQSNDPNLLLAELSTIDPSTWPNNTFNGQGTFNSNMNQTSVDPNHIYPNYPPNGMGMSNFNTQMPYWNQPLQQAQQLPQQQVNNAALFYNVPTTQAQQQQQFKNTPLPSHIPTGVPAGNNYVYTTQSFASQPSYNPGVMPNNSSCQQNARKRFAATGFGAGLAIPDTNAYNSNTVANRSGVPSAYFNDARTTGVTSSGAYAGNANAVADKNIVAQGSVNNVNPNPYAAGGRFPVNDNVKYGAFATVMVAANVNRRSTNGMTYQTAIQQNPWYPFVPGAGVAGGAATGANNYNVNAVPNINFIPGAGAKNIVPGAFAAGPTPLHGNSYKVGLNAAQVHSAANTGATSNVDNNMTANLTAKGKNINSTSPTKKAHKDSSQAANETTKGAANPPKRTRQRRKRKASTSDLPTPSSGPKGRKVSKTKSSDGSSAPRRRTGRPKKNPVTTATAAPAITAAAAVHGKPIPGSSYVDFVNDGFEGFYFENGERAKDDFAQPSAAAAAASAAAAAQYASMQAQVAPVAHMTLPMMQQQEETFEGFFFEDDVERTMGPGPKAAKELPVLGEWWKDLVDFGVDEEVQSGDGVTTGVADAYPQAGAATEAEAARRLQDDLGSEGDAEGEDDPEYYQNLGNANSGEPAALDQHDAAALNTKYAANPTSETNLDEVCSFGKFLYGNNSIWGMDGAMDQEDDEHGNHARLLDRHDTTSQIGVDGDNVFDSDEIMGDAPSDEEPEKIDPDATMQEVLEDKDNLEQGKNTPEHRLADNAKAAVSNEGMSYQQLLEESPFGERLARLQGRQRATTAFDRKLLASTSSHPDGLKAKALVQSQSQQKALTRPLAQDKPKAGVTWKFVNTTGPPVKRKQAARHPENIVKVKQEDSDTETVAQSNKSDDMDEDEDDFPQPSHYNSIHLAAANEDQDAGSEATILVPPSSPPYTSDMTFEQALGRAKQNRQARQTHQTRQVGSNGLTIPNRAITASRQTAPPSSPPEIPMITLTGPATPDQHPAPTQVLHPASVVPAPAQDVCPLCYNECELCRLDLRAPMPAGQCLFCSWRYLRIPEYIEHPSSIPFVAGDQDEAEWVRWQIETFPAKFPWLTAFWTRILDAQEEWVSRHGFGVVPGLEGAPAVYYPRLWQFIWVPIKNEER